MGTSHPRLIDSVVSETGGMWRRWSGNAAFSLLDQVIASGGNFLVSILLARWLVPSEYGAFSVAFEVFLFATLFHNALILEPMKVLGARRFAGRIGMYLRAQLVLHALVAGMAGGGLILAGLLFEARGNQVAPALIGFGVAFPFILLFWLVRHGAYVQTRPIMALKSSATYAVVLCTGLALLWSGGWISAWRTGLLMGVAGLSAGALSSRSLFGQEPGTAVSRVVLREISREHWRYGKWVMAAGLLGWLSSAAYTPIVAAWSGLEVAASLRAVQNLMLPMSQILTALAILLLPAVSQRALSGGGTYLRRTALKISLVLGGLSLSYVVGVLTFAPWILGFFYGGDKYLSNAWLLPFYGTMLCLRSIADCGLGVALRAAGRSDLIFYASAGAACTLLIGTPLVMLYGLEGAAFGLLLSAFTHFAIIIFLFHKLTRGMRTAA